MKNIVLVDDEVEVLDMLAQALAGPDRQIHGYSDPLQALERIPSHGADLIITDLRMPGMDGQTFLVHCRERFPSARIAMLTAHGGVTEAVQAMKAGAVDFFTKPLNLAELAEKVDKLLTLQEAARIARASHPDLPAVGGTRAMDETLKLAETVAPRDAAVLITGETGVGKEVLADFIQGRSKRVSQPYIKVNCVALSASLIESELFGHERGAFTGASERRTGRFERANRGTLFLDEIAELPMELQPKLLRVLQSKEIERVGGEAPIKVDFRLIAATNRDLPAMVKAGKFREDLYYRVNVFPIQIPALRERPDDILLLAQAFLRRAEQTVGVKDLRLASDAQDVLTQYSWPGNVRELENAIERAVVMASGRTLTSADFWWLSEEEESAGPAQEVPAALPEKSNGATVLPAVDNPLDEAERQTLITILEKNRWNYTKAAQELRVSRSTLYAKAARYGIKR
jgi:DNA-binding NtrC family response regulator